MTEAAAPEIPLASRRQFQRSWFWYDWANSAYVTTVATVLMAPYLTAIAKEAACPGLAENAQCDATLSVLGIPIAPGSLAPYTTTVATIVSAIVLIFTGAIVDRTSQPTRLLGGFAWLGSAAACGMFFVQGTNWQLGVALIILATVSLGSSLVVYDALLVRISTPDERDGVSSRGWAMGYLGGGILLAINLVVVSMYETFGMSKGMSVRVSLLSAGLWWAIFTLIPYLGLRKVKGTQVTPVDAKAGVVGGSLRQLQATFRELRLYPQTLLFLVAYLFFNDGIQTVIASASLYGDQELGFGESQLIVTVLLVQFVAVGGALLFGRMAAVHGAKKMILSGLGLWMAVVVVAFFMPAQQFGLWLVLAVGIGIVLGGTQALARSLFSQLIPRGREGEFFSLYQAMERGTSWSGALIFGLVYQFAGSYRLSIVALILFFGVGGYLLFRCNIREGIRQAGNDVPAVV
ncbi:MFS transporter [Demetria terragena]|uniref:MFS transporter n=1 Tax=Demetria terragena TaxID=63959 RepID=UPI00047652A0